METISASNVVKAQQEKLKEIQAQQEKLKILQVELERLKEKIEKNEKLTPDESAYLGQLGWLSAAAVTIASIAASL
jgi:flagellar motility protein MotE (MotC chaperone)